MGADEQPQDPKLSLKVPSLFGRGRKTAAEQPTAPVAPAASLEQEQGDTRVFADSGSDASLTDAEVSAAEVHDDAPLSDEATATKPRRVPRLPNLSKLPNLSSLPHGSLVVPTGLGAPLAGLLTGIALLVFMWLGFRGCEVLSGTESCGKGPGMVALIVVFALTVIVGRVLLALLKMPEPVMTSFLGVGVTSLVAVLILGGLFDSVVILVVLPLLMAATFAGSAWLATVQFDSDA